MLEGVYRVLWYGWEIFVTRHLGRVRSTVICSCGCAHQVVEVGALVDEWGEGGVGHV
jgi:hypothetical protein